MHQALHIFKKDVRYLRREITLVVLIAVLLAALHSPDYVRVIEFALVGAMAFLIGRLVLAEAIPGDRQFWITRPYRWQSLLGAKLLFIAAFVNLPVFLAHIFILLLEGFPLLSNVPGLLWSQVLLFAFLALPVAALAALSSGMAAFIFAQLIVAAAGYGLWEMVLVTKIVRLGDAGGAGWVRDSIAFVAISIIALAVLLLQYIRRRTIFSRGFALASVALGALAYAAMPFPMAFALQTHVSKQAALGSSMRIALDGSSGWQYWSHPVGPGILLHLPILIQGIPEGTEVQADALRFTLQSPDHRVARLDPLDCSGLRRATLSASNAMIYAECLIDPAFYKQERGQPLNLRASFYFTLFGNARTQTVPLTDQPTNALDGLQCYTNVVKAEWDVYCRAAFRWPDRLVYAKLGHTDANSFAQFVSYSPFPASLNIDPIETRWASAYASGPPPTVRDVTILVEEPLGHLERDFEARDVRLNQFTSQPVGTVPAR